VPQQQYIRFLREVEGCSIQEIAERVQVNWRTAKKYADRDDWNEPVCKRKGRHPVLGPYIEIIDTWLEEDERLPIKSKIVCKFPSVRMPPSVPRRGRRREHAPCPPSLAVWQPQQRIAGPIKSLLKRACQGYMERFAALTGYDRRRSADARHFGTHVSGL
jgi:hypothetical protein